MKTSRVFSFLLALAVVASVAGCSQTKLADVSDVTVSSMGSSASADNPPGVPSAETSPRGKLVKTRGVPAIYVDTSDTEVARFTVDAVTDDVKCTEPYAQPITNGHLIALDVTVITQPGLTELTSTGISVGSQWNWTFYSESGTRFNGDVATPATISCLPSATTLPSNIGPGENAQGLVVLDVPDTKGVLAFSESGSSWGWEWNLADF